MPDERQITVNPIAPDDKPQGSRHGETLASAFPASPVTATSLSGVGQVSESDIREFYLNSVIRKPDGIKGFCFPNYNMLYVDPALGLPVETKVLNPLGAPNGVIVATDALSAGQPSSAMSLDGFEWPRPTPVSAPSGIRGVVGAQPSNQTVVLTPDVNIGQTSVGYGSGPNSPQQPIDTSNNDIASEFISDWLSPPAADVEPPAE